MSETPPPAPDLGALDGLCNHLRWAAEQVGNVESIDIPPTALLAVLDHVDAQAARLAAAEQFRDLGAHTAACQAGRGYGGCEQTCARLRSIIATVAAGEA